MAGRFLSPGTFHKTGFRIAGCLALTALLASLSRAGSVYLPNALEKLPSPDDVVAFANYPPVARRTPSRQLTRQDILLFLHDGARRVDFRDQPDRDRDQWCGGVFFTQSGDAYFWRLWNSHDLELITSDNRSCYVSLDQAKVHSLAAPRSPNDFLPLKPPAPQNLAAFTNSNRPATGFQMKLTQGDIVRFLTDGETVTDRMSIIKSLGDDHAQITPNQEMLQWFKAHNRPSPEGAINPVGENLHIDGAFSTKDGAIYFWRLLDDRILHLSDPKGAECILKLP